MKKKTALQEAIAQLTDHLNFLGKHYGTSSEKYRTKQGDIDTLKKLLPLEREHLEEAHDKATENYREGYPTPITGGAVYYEQTYNTEE